MKPLFLIFLLMLCGTGCASLNPLVSSTRDPETGEKKVTYYTHAYSAHGVTGEGDVGYFLVGRTSMRNTGKLRAYFYNLEAAPMRIRLKEWSVYKRRLVPPGKAVNLKEESRVAFKSRSFGLSNYAGPWPVRLDLEVDGTPFIIEAKLVRTAFPTYWNAVFGDVSAPHTVSEFYSMRNRSP